MGISKVIVNNVTKVDLTSDTVAANKLVSNYTAHDKAGNAVTGTIATKTASNVTVNGATVTVPVGLYESAVSKTVATGSAKTPATTITSNPSISVSSGGLITASNSKTQSVTPTVTAGYVSSGTAGTITVSGSNTQQLTTKAEEIYFPTTSNQIISSGQFLTGNQTIMGDSDLLPANIAEGVTIFNVTGTHRGGSLEEQYLNFYDYDGTLLYSYPMDQVSSIHSSLPANPTHHTNLIAQGWNWTVYEIESMVNSGASIIDVGQIYQTSTSNNVHITKIRLEGIQAEERYWLQLYFSGNNTYINVYSSAGSYEDVHYVNQFGLIGPFDFGNDIETIEIVVYSGSIEFKNNNTNCILRLDGNPDGYEYNRAAIDIITSINLGDNVSIGDYAFYHCRRLEKILIPNSQAITYGIIGDHAFEGCNHLKHVNFPRGGISSFGKATFKNCKNLRVVTFPGDAYNVDIDQEIFMSSGIEHTTIAIDEGSYGNICDRAFKDSALRCIGLNPYGATSILSGAFQNCAKFDGWFSYYNFWGPSTGVEYLGSYALSGCLDFDFMNAAVILPYTVSDISEGLFYQSSIRSFQFEDFETGNANITAIPAYFFKNCDYLHVVIIPESISEIGVQAFADCPALRALNFYPTTPPTVSNSNAFANLPTSCHIYVPSGCLSAYTSATNYPSSSTYSYHEM